MGYDSTNSRRGAAPTVASDFHEQELDALFDRAALGYDAGANLYRYAYNNPINQIDPSGMYPQADAGPRQDVAGRPLTDFERGLNRLENLSPEERAYNKRVNTPPLSAQEPYKTLIEQGKIARVNGQWRIVDDKFLAEVQAAEERRKQVAAGKKVDAQRQAGPAPSCAVTSQPEAMRPLTDAEKLAIAEELKKRALMEYAESLKDAINKYGAAAFQPDLSPYFLPGVLWGFLKAGFEDVKENSPLVQLWDTITGKTWCDAKKSAEQLKKLGPEARKLLEEYGPLLWQLYHSLNSGKLEEFKGAVNDPKAQLAWLYLQIALIVLQTKLNELSPAEKGELQGVLTFHILVLLLSAFLGGAGAAGEVSEAAALAQTIAKLGKMEKLARAGSAEARWLQKTIARLKKFLVELERAEEAARKTADAASLQGPVNFGKNFDKKVRKHIDQVRNRCPVKENIPAPGKGGTKRVQEIIRERVARGGGRATTYAGEPAIAFEDGGVTYIFRPNGEFWTILGN